MPPPTPGHAFEPLGIDRDDTDRMQFGMPEQIAYPRIATSRTTPAPVAPPPTTTTSASMVLMSQAPSGAPVQLIGTCLCAIAKSTTDSS